MEIEESGAKSFLDMSEAEKIIARARQAFAEYLDEKLRDPVHDPGSASARHQAEQTANSPHACLCLSKGKAKQVNKPFACLIAGKYSFL